MGVCTVTLTTGGSEASGQRARVTGMLKLSASYDAGTGDTLDSHLLGLATVEDLFLFTPRLATGGAIADTFFPVVRSLLPIRNANILIMAFTDYTTEAAGDLTPWEVPFLALGVGI